MLENKKSKHDQTAPRNASEIYTSADVVGIEKNRLKSRSNVTFISFLDTETHLLFD